MCCFGQKYLYIYDEFDVTELLGEEVGVFAYVMYRGGAFCPGTLCVCPPPDPSVCVSPPGTNTHRGPGQKAGRECVFFFLLIVLIFDRLPGQKLARQFDSTRSRVI